MNWRGSQLESRKLYLKFYDAIEVEAYERWIAQLTGEDDDACLRDIQTSFHFESGMKVLDVGAGTGAMCKTLLAIGGLKLFALEPVPAMIKKFRSKSALGRVVLTEGFCDSLEDRHHFAENSFDVIVSRQLVNGLFDPLSAFRNWIHWLQPGGTVVVMDGLFDRNAWTGELEQVVDKLPMSACRSIAMVPYLLENVGFQIDKVGFMSETNARPGTRTQRYLVVASKPESP